MKKIFNSGDISIYFQIRKKVTNDNCWVVYNLVEINIISIWGKVSQIL